MAFYDVVVLYEDAFEESKGGNDRGTFSINRVLLAKSDTPNPSFIDIGTSTATWPGLFNQKIDQLNDIRDFDGIIARCASRKFSWFKGTESGVQIDLTYEGLSSYENTDAGGSQQPKTYETETWRRISISTSQISQPATDKDGKSFCNSAGDPVDGLEEESAIAVLKYSNEFNPSPALYKVWDWLNTCNKTEYLGAAPYTLRVTGFSADFDDKAMFWKTSLEITYNPKTWSIEYYDAGYNELELVTFPNTYARKAIKDNVGNPVSQPVPLNGFGQAATPAVPTPVSYGDAKNFTLPATVTLNARPYEEKDFNLMLSDLGMY